MLRLSGAVVLLGVTSMYMLGANPVEWYRDGKPLYLALSGVIGLAIGDSALFRSMLLFGPRRATLMLSVVPILTAIIAWFLLDERLNLITWTGIILTVSGIGWVVLERTSANNSQSSDGLDIKKGLQFGLVAALCQSIGLILAKAGMGETMNPVSATFMRMIAGWAGMVIITLFGTGLADLNSALKDRRALLLTGAGTIVGPFLGVWGSLIAVKYAETGVAATLMGLMPIFVIPWVWIIYKEKTSPRALIGTIVAILGTALLFLR